MDKVPMTAEGYAALEAEIKYLKTVERPRINKQISDAGTHGDLSESAEYHAAKEQQGITEARVADLEDKLSRADVIDVSKRKGDQIMFGATVTLLDEDTDEKVKYRIVGELEATDPTMVGQAPLRLWCVPGKRHLAKFGQEIASFSLKFFEDYYGLAYPGDKLDLLAVVVGQVVINPLNRQIGNGPADDDSQGT